MNYLQRAAITLYHMRHAWRLSKHLPQLRQTHRVRSSITWEVIAK